MEVGNHRIGYCKVIGREDKLVSPSFVCLQMTVCTTVLPMARITVIRQRKPVRSGLWHDLTMPTASSVHIICSESVLCFVGLPHQYHGSYFKLACSVIYAKSIPLISRRFINSRLKCRLAVGAVTAPSLRAKDRLEKPLESSALTGRLIML